jgi:hypothetical protein
MNKLIVWSIVFCFLLGRPAGADEILVVGDLHFTQGDGDPAARYLRGEMRTAGPSVLRPA